MRHITLLPLVLTVAAFGSAVAQDPLLIPGQRVRIATVTRPRMGYEFQRLNADTIVLEDEHGRPFVSPLRDITSLQVQTPTTTGRRLLEGAALGLAGGAAGGFALGFAVGLIECSAEALQSKCGNSPLERGAAWGLALGATGAVLGAVIRTLKPGEHWEELPVGHLQFSLVPQRDGFGIGASIAF